MAGMFLVFGIGCNGAGSDKKYDSNKGNNGMNKNTYPVIFADAARSSFIDVTSKSEGYLTWKKIFNDDDEIPLGLRCILIGGANIFACSDDTVICFDTDGKKLWTKPIRESSPVSIHGGKLYYRKIETIDELAAVDFKGADYPQTMWILESDNACTPLYIEPLDGEFLALSLCTPPPEQGRPSFVFYRKKYETEKFIWVDNIAGKPAAPPLHTPDGAKFIVFAENEIIIYDANSAKSDGDIINRFPNPVQKIISVAAGDGDVIYLLGKSEDKNILLALAHDGTEKWRWTDDTGIPGVSLKQPPVVGIDGLVHIPVGRTLKTIRDGELVREFTIEERTIDFCSALADGSVLIAAKNSLYRADPDGNKIFGLLFDHDIVAPPVADAQGHIYIATDYELIRID